jgi:hypothetical protein
MISAALGFLMVLPVIFVTALVLQFQSREYEKDSTKFSKKGRSPRNSLTPVPVDPIEDLLNVAALYDENGYRSEKRAIGELEAELVQATQADLNSVFV